MSLGLKRAIRGALGVSGVHYHSSALPYSLQFLALVPDATTYEMLGVSTGTGDLTTTHTSTIYAKDHEDVYRAFGANEPVWSGARITGNVALYSNDPTNAQWTKSNTSITAGISDPDGGSDAHTVTADAGNAQLNNTITSENWTSQLGISSIWVRRRTGTGTIYLYDVNASILDITSIISDGQWHRVTTTNTRTGNPRIGFFITDSGDEIDIYNAQVEDGTGRSSTTPSEYIPTTTAAVTKVFANANGNSVASNVVTEGIGAALAEMPYLDYVPAATNSQIQSNDLTNAEWTATTMTVAKDETGIDGTANGACTLTATGANSTVIANAITQASGNQSTCWYIKRKTGTGNVDLTLDNGATWTTVTLTTAFQKFTIDQAALANPQIGIRLVASADAVIVGNAECHLTKTLAEVRGLPPTFTTTAAVSTDKTVYSFNVANHNQNASSYFLEWQPSYPSDANLTSMGILTTLTTGLGLISDAGNPVDAIASADGTNTNTVSQAWTADKKIKCGLTFFAADNLMTISISGEGAGIGETEGTYDGGYPIGSGLLYIASSQAYAMKIKNIRRYNIDNYAAGNTLIDGLMA